MICARSLLVLLASLTLGVNGDALAADDQPAAASLSDADRDYFEKQVRPLLVERCFACHGGTKAGGGLSLQTAEGWRKGGESGPAIVPGKPEESLLIDAIHYRSFEMPPPDSGGPLAEDEIAILTHWIARGAPDPRDGSDVIGGMTREEAQSWWAFQPLPKLAPATTFAEDVQQIDRLVQRELDARDIEPVGPADPRTLLRRLTYDVTGLPPTYAEVEAFRSDPSPQALDAVIERLLSSPQYGVHWGRHWLDVARYADTAGENTDRPLPHAWRYRNWVIDAFNRDLPFDQFVRLQLAGDLLTQEQHGDARAEGIVATGYLAIARRFGHDIDKDMYLTYEDVIDNVGKAFLGLSLGCARCHDHKYDPVSAADYYALYGIFASTRFAFPGCEPQGQPRDLVPLLDPVELAARMEPWQAKVAEAEAEKQRRLVAAQLATEKIQSAWTASARKLASAHVDEGASVPFEQRVTVRSGEVVVLTVFPNDNHGADSTRVEWTVSELGGDGRSWSITDVVADLLHDNPWRAADGATWSFLEATASPAFLAEQRDGLSGHSSLKSWSLGSEPSVFVNASDQTVNAWTPLPAKSFFVHPGPSRPVAVAWTSPLDGQVLLQGRVADAHPAALDGVAFQLDHLASTELAHALADIGRWSVGQPDPGPPPVIPVAYAVVDGEIQNVRIHERGDPEKLGAEVPRRWLSIFGGAEVAGDAESGRRELADWITQHPLMARVMVNRIWQWHFGRGLVRSPNDFGARGELPTHPELLDFLAARFRQSGYSIKAMHRLILHTAAYRRASATPAAGDPENRWLAHFNRRRLSAEELRDSLLTASGQLDLTPGQEHPFPAESTWTFTQHAPFNAVYETNRRSVFLMVQRQRQHPFLALFDGADPNASTPARESTVVPTQALYFINDPFFHEQSEHLARLLIAAASDDSARLRLAAQTVLQRDPAVGEQQRLQRFLDDYPGSSPEKWAALARVLMASNEHLYVE